MVSVDQSGYQWQINFRIEMFLKYFKILLLLLQIFFKNFLVLYLANVIFSFMSSIYKIKYRAENQFPNCVTQFLNVYDKYLGDVCNCLKSTRLKINEIPSSYWWMKQLLFKMKKQSSRRSSGKYYLYKILYHYIHNDLKIQMPQTSTSFLTLWVNIYSTKNNSEYV